MVEDMLAARSIIVTHQTIRNWAEKFGAQFAKDLKRRSAGRFGDRWHLDECVVVMNGNKQWLWPAVEHRHLRSAAMNVWREVTCDVAV